MKKLILFFVLPAVLLLSPGGASAQMGAADPTGLNAAMMRLFGTNTSFTAKASMRLLDAQKKEAMMVPMGFSMLEGKMRAEVDLTTMKSQEMPPEVAANFKRVGLEKVISVVLPESKSTLVIYPGLKGYARVPMVGKDLEDMEKKYDLKVTKIAEETFEGQPCVKNKILLTARAPAKETHEATVWNATALKDFPIKVEMKQKEGQGILEMVFREVKLGSPAAALFEAPVGYMLHESMEKMLQGAMAQLLGQQGKPQN